MLHILRTALWQAQTAQKKPRSSKRKAEDVGDSEGEELKDDDPKEDSEEEGSDEEDSENNCPAVHSNVYYRSSASIGTCFVRACQNPKDWQ